MELTESIAKIKKLCVSIKPTGHDGFEGLLALVLEQLTGYPFRLAKSGSQFGLDGRSVYQPEAIAFESKRYDDTQLDTNDILSKVGQLPSSNSPVDIWILAATVEVPDQINQLLKPLGEELSVTIITLDWQEHSLSPLLLTICNAEETFLSFLGRYTDQLTDLCEARSAIKKIKNHSLYHNQLQSLIDLFDKGSSNYLAAKKQNRMWLQSAFESPLVSKQRFGQRLCPADAGNPFIIRRPELEKSLLNKVSQSQPEFICVKGGEGHGKSWVVAQSFINNEKFPILLVCKASELKDKQASLEEFLITKLIQQTGSTHTDDNAQSKWKKRLSNWQNDSTAFVLWVDGINEAPYISWSLTIDSLVALLLEYSGKLIVTSRPYLFDHEVEDNIDSQYCMLTIPQWTQEQRNTLLEKVSVAPDELQPNAASALLNPRLLGIALELLSKGEIQGGDQISINRLLFEHIRLGTKLTHREEKRAEFILRLKQNAQVYLNNATKSSGSLPPSLEGDLSNVVDGRFYQELSASERRYTITEEGLPLALGFAILSSLNECQRKDIDIDEFLGKTLEPILAIDDTSDIVLATMTIEALGENRQTIMSSLSKCFTQLQNFHHHRYPEFASLVKSNPLAALLGLKALRLRNEYRNSIEWLEHALRTVCHDIQNSPELEKEILSWLSFYNLDPKVSAWLTASKSDEEKQHEIAKRQNELDKKISELTNTEKSILAEMKSVDYQEYDSLHKLAYELLAQNPIASYADDFLKAIFSRCFNSSHSAGAYENFIALVRLNKADPSQTLIALKKAIRNLEADSSRLGKMTLMSMYSAIGEHEAAVKRELLDEQVYPRDEYPRYSSRLVEKYCDTDPCDPNSNAPSNISKTANDYKALTNIRQTRSSSSETLFFEDARPGLARFSPNVAIHKHRELMGELLTRKDEALFACILECERHSALLDKRLVSKLLTRWNDLDKETDNDDKRVYQDLLLIAFPHLSQEEKLKVLVSFKNKRAVQLKLLDLLEKFPDAVLDRQLQSAIDRGDTDEQCLVLFIANYTGSSFGTSSYPHIKNFFLSDDELLREQSLGAIYNSKGNALLDFFASSNWQPKTNTRRNRENNYGTLLTLKCLDANKLTVPKSFARIPKPCFGLAASTDNVELGLTIFDEATKAIEFLTLRAHKESLDIQTAINMIDSFGRHSFKKLLENHPDSALNWFDLFERVNTNQLTWVKAFVIRYAEAMAKTHPEKAHHLLAKISDVDPNCNSAYSYTSLHIETVANWHVNLPEEKLTQNQINSLKGAKSNYDIAQSVLAALFAKREIDLQKYVLSKAASTIPTDVANAILVVGFSDVCDFNDEILAQHSKIKGLVGDAWKAAKYAYERNKWARHWYGLMCETGSKEDYWRFSMLFLKVVDARFEYWKSEFQLVGQPIKKFKHCFEERLEHRYKTWKKKREEKLFGSKSPNKIFLC